MRAKPRTMGLEKLESREVFSGNVLVALNSLGHLQLTGDSQANSVEIYGTGNNNFVVKGQGTNINGFANPQTFHVNSGKIDAYMNGGNDHINLHDAAINSLYAVMGAGSDEIDVTNVNASSSGDGLQLDMGTDNSKDSIYLAHDHIFGDLEASLGGGDDLLSLNDTKVDYLLSVDGGAGTDTYSLVNSHVGNTLNVTSFEKVVNLNYIPPVGVPPIGLPTTSANKH